MIVLDLFVDLRSLIVVVRACEGRRSVRLLHYVLRSGPCAGRWSGHQAVRCRSERWIATCRLSTLVARASARADAESLAGPSGPSRAGTLIRWVRIVAVVARAWNAPAKAPVAWVSGARAPTARPRPRWR